MNDQTLAKIQTLAPVVADSAYRFIRDARLDGAPVVVVEGYRSQTRQDALYEQGRTRPGPIVTGTRNSRHTQRRAFDVAFIVGGRLTYDVPQTWWQYLGALAPRYGLRWGPDIGIRGDYGHFEA